MPDSYTPAWLTASRTRTRRSWCKRIWSAFVFIVKGALHPARRDKVYVLSKASIADVEDECKESYELTATMVWKVPKKLIGKPLNQKQANALVKKQR